MLGGPRMGISESKLGSTSDCTSNLLCDSGPLWTHFQPSNVIIHTWGESSCKGLSTEAGKESVLRTSRCQVMSIRYQQSLLGLWEKFIEIGDSFCPPLLPPNQRILARQAHSTFRGFFKKRWLFFTSKSKIMLRSRAHNLSVTILYQLILYQLVKMKLDLFPHQPKNNGRAQALQESIPPLPPSNAALCRHCWLGHITCLKFHVRKTLMHQKSTSPLMR